MFIQGQRYIKILKKKQQGQEKPAPEEKI